MGITELHFHDLPGTAVTMINEAGVSMQPIASITGHTMGSATQILKRYSAQTKRLAEATIEAWENGSRTRFANHRSGRAGDASQK